MTDKQDKINEQIIQSLSDIKAQTRQTNDKIDALDAKLTKKATVAGAVAGAVTGSVTSGMVSVGIELIRAKFGG